MQIATQTLKLLDDCVSVDQGNAYRANLQRVLPHIGDIYRSDEDGFRSHLGASLIGGDCGRALWYSFRWFKKVKFEGHVIRLFNRGHMEEARIIALLLTAGIRVYQQDENGKQFRISLFGGHFGGSGDGIAVGVPDIPINIPALLEFKTHSDKSFKEVSEKGVLKAKPEHFIQMQMYLNGMNLYYALYIAVNKNTDEIHAEIVVKDEKVSAQFESRAEKIIFSLTPPPKISTKPSWYQCKFCDYHSLCHKSEKPEVNCRTCIYAIPERDGSWICRMTGEILSKEQQSKGCQYHSLVT